MSQPRKKTTTTKTRAKKKAVVKVVVPAKMYNFEGPVFPEGVMHLSPMDLMKFELVQAKAANLAQAVVLKRNEMDEYQRVFTDRMHRLRQEVSQYSVGVKDSQNALNVAKAELQEAYGIDLTTIVYDDLSGKVHLLQDSGSPIPLLKK